MAKKILITEKPSVAMEFAKVLNINGARKDGYLESGEWIITWCVGHLVTMSYPEKYDEKLKLWRLDTLPFIPKDFKYEIIEEIGVLSESQKGWRKELNLISWNNGTPKYDIRDWAPGHEKMGKGITLSEEEIRKLKELL